MMSPEEVTARSGLQIVSHADIWYQAQRIAEDSDALYEDLSILPYWERVRAIFLELGGKLQHAPE